MAVTINYRFASTIASLFRNEGNDEYPQLSQSGISWSNNNVLNMFIKCDLSGSEFEIPVAIRGYAGKELKYALNKTFSSIGEKELVVPMMKQNYTNVRRTSDSILKLFFDSPIQYGMMSVKTNKDIQYYGGKGYIFDADFNPIFLATMVGHYDIDNTDKVLGYTWTECRVYLHPSVIIDGSDLVSKGIMKKVLPYLLSSRDALPYSRNPRVKVGENIKVKVIVEDVNKFFRTPTPMRANFTNEEIAYCVTADSPRHSFAGRWCVKEALHKCCEKYYDIVFKDIQVAKHKNGNVSIEIRKNNKWHELPIVCSISHADNYAVGIVTGVAL